MTGIQKWRQWASSLKRHTLALYYACKDPRSPWLSRWLALFLVAYIVSPIDLIPDFIPVLGYLDELILVPFGCWILIKTLPEEVWQDSLKRADLEPVILPKSHWMTVFIILIWILLAAGLISLLGWFR